MGAIFGVVATVVALVGLLLALWNLGYLGMLGSAAGKRGAAGSPIAGYVKGRLPLAAGAAGAGLVACLLTTGGPVPDVLGLILGVAAGLVANRSLSATRARFRNS